MLAGKANSGTDRTLARMADLGTDKRPVGMANSGSDRILTAYGSSTGREDPSPDTQAGMCSEGT